MTFRKVFFCDDKQINIFSFELMKLNNPFKSKTIIASRSTYAVGMGSNIYPCLEWSQGRACGPRRPDRQLQSPRDRGFPALQTIMVKFKVRWDSRAFCRQVEM